MPPSNVLLPTLSEKSSSPADADTLIATILDSPALLPSLAQIRDNQRLHEQSWWKARTAILEKYNKKRQLNEMLVSVGGSEGLSEAEIARQEKVEVEAFDGKLRMAMGKMYLSQIDEIRGLGIKVVKDKHEMDRVYGIIEELLDQVSKI